MAPESRKSYLHRMASEQKARTAKRAAPKPKPATAQVKTVGGVNPNAKAKAPKAGTKAAARLESKFRHNSTKSMLDPTRPHHKDVPAELARRAAAGDPLARAHRASGEESVQQKAPSPAKETQAQYSDRLRKSLNPKGVSTPDMGEHRAARSEMTPAERRAAPPLPRQSTPKQSSGGGKKRDLVMTPRQIARRAARARKAGKG